MFGRLIGWLLIDQFVTVLVCHTSVLVVKLPQQIFHDKKTGQTTRRVVNGTSSMKVEMMF